MISNSIRWGENISESGGGVGFFGNAIVKTLLGASILPIAVLAGVLGYFIRPIDNLIVLHYNVYFGVDVLGAWWQAYFPLALALMFFLGHTLLAKYFYGRSERIAAYLLLLSSGWLAIGALIAGSSIAFINY